MARVILTPQLVGGWLSEMREAVEGAAAGNLDAEVEGYLEGALVVDKKGRAMLVQKLAAEMPQNLVATLLDGLPVDVEGSIEVGWERETKVGRIAWGHVRARFATRPVAVAMPLPDAAAAGAVEVKAA